MLSRHPYQLNDEPIPGYRLVKFLGRGGFGEVWKAAAPGGAAVALKVIVNLSGSEGRKELRALSIVKRIQHAHLVPVTAVWLKDADGNVLNDDFAGEEDRLLNQRSPTSSDATTETMIVPPGRTDPRSAELLIAMGLGHKSLFDRLQECREQGLEGIPAAELLDYMEQAARAIDYLNSATHELGKDPIAVQHCDIKPHNILIVGTAVQVCDFGLARVRGDVRATASTGASVAYASPECLDSDGGPSEATDQYSLAISYYELRTGSLPYRDTTFAKVMQAVLTGNLDFSKLPAAEQGVIRRATARDPKQRFPSAMAMVKALRRAVEAPEAPAAAPRRWPKVAVALLLLVGLGSGLAWYRYNQQGGAQQGDGGNQNGGVKQPSLTEIAAAGQAAFERGDRTGAAELFAQALAIDPGYPPALIGRARIRVLGGDLDGAIGDFQRARQRDPEAAAPADEARALNARAIQRLTQGKYNDAIDDLLAARELDPAAVDNADLANAYLLRADLRRGERMFGDAVEDYTFVIDNLPDARGKAHLGRAHCYWQMDDASAALADANAAIEADPELAEAYYIRGAVRQSRQQTAEAVADLERAFELDPALKRQPDAAPLFGKALRALGDDLLTANDLDGAIQRYSQAAELDPDGALGLKSHAAFAEAYTRRGQQHHQANEQEAAMAAYTRAIEDHPQHAGGALCERGYCFVEQGKNEQAMADFDAAIALDPKNDLAYSRRGWLRLQVGQPDGALSDLDEAIRLKGDYFDYFNRALTLYALDRLPEAREAFDKLIAEKAGDAELFYQRAIVNFDAGDYPGCTADLAEARTLLEAELKDNPNAVKQSRDRLAAVLALFGWVIAGRADVAPATAQEGLSAAKEACTHSDWKVPWHIDALAAAYAGVGDFAKAVQWEEEAIKLAEDSQEEALPPAAPGRDYLLQLYQAKKKFRLSGQAEPSAADAANSERPTAGDNAPSNANSRPTGNAPGTGVGQPGVFQDALQKLQTLPRPGQRR